MKMITLIKVAMVSIGALILSSCASLPPLPSTKIQPTIEIIEMPKLNEVAEGYLGDSLVRKGFVSYKPGIRLKEEWTWKKTTSVTPRHWVAVNTEFIQEDIVLVRDRAYTCYLGKYNYDAHWNWYNKIGTDLPLKLCTNEEKEWVDQDMVYFGEQSSLTERNLPFDAKYEEFTYSEYGSGNIIKEFIYNGRVGDSLKFIYREFSGDMARPAFTQEAQYDLNNSNIIGFKKLRIKVIEASNVQIKFIVLTNFS